MLPVENGEIRFANRCRHSATEHVSNPMSARSESAKVLGARTGSATCGVSCRNTTKDDHEPRWSIRLYAIIEDSYRCEVVGARRGLFSRWCERCEYGRLAGGADTCCYFSIGRAHVDCHCLTR